uniref:Uncharacterized protein LOC102806177 n=1 Tax=Saccoglossus kowalevskii TaxID=10224 RepID=A0ABM0MQ72_SACKO|nr:PREDICTED: uncharacterized protein LOC102806177 [Saccoglossus kowalevskii]
MVLSQLGAGVKNAIITLLGCLTGALIYGIVEPAVMKLTKPRRPYKAFMLNQVTPTPFFVLALPIASVLAIVIFVVEHFVPWRTDLTVPNEPNATWISVRAWSPILTGVIVGCLQIPLVLAVKDTMGGSSSYCTVVSQILVTKPLRSLSPYLSKYRTGLANWWQVLYVSGAVFGAWMSANCSDTLGTVDGVSTATSFIGGVVMVFGSRLAAGCTSGHGLSGVGTLSLLSFVTVPAIFAGGMAAAFMLRTLAVI